MLLSPSNTLLLVIVYEAIIVCVYTFKVLRQYILALCCVTINYLAPNVNMPQKCNSHSVVVLCVCVSIAYPLDRVAVYYVNYPFSQSLWHSEFLQQCVWLVFLTI